MLHGRDTELAEIERVLADIRSARASILIIRGDIGIGKSALLDTAAERAAGIRTLRSASIPSESNLAFAGLHLLLHPFADRIRTLPSLQAEALLGALGEGESPVTDRYSVALAVLIFLADMAKSSPVLCLIDDAHFMDDASIGALLFAARRFETEPIAMIFATRDEPRMVRALGIPELRLNTLSSAASADLLADHACDLAAPVRDRILEESDGNPLALIELSAALDPRQWAGHPRAPDLGGTKTLQSSSRLQRTFADRINVLPERSRLLLLVAAADDFGELSIVLNAAERLGASLADLQPIEEQRLLEFKDGRFRFRHALARAVAYDGAPASRRRAVHRALADAVDPDTEADRRARHLAATTVMADEAIASALERGAERTRRRHGCATVAATCERAAQLTIDDQGRGRRLVLAAQAATDAGRLDWAEDLADQADRHVTDQPLRAELSRIRAIVGSERGDPRAVNERLVEAAVMFAAPSPDDAASALFEATAVAWIGGDRQLAAATARCSSALDLPMTPKVQPFVRGVSGLAHLIAGELEEALPALRDMFEAAHCEEEALSLRERATIGLWEFLTGDFERSYGAAVMTERNCRLQGAFGVLPRALLWLARDQFFLGLHRDAMASASDGVRIAQETSQDQYAGFLNSFLAYLAAISGDTARCEALVHNTGTPLSGLLKASNDCASALMDLGLGRWEEVLKRLSALSGTPTWPAVASFALPDLVEAAVRLGCSDLVVEQARGFESWTARLGMPWAKALALRCRALLVTDEDPEPYFLEALGLQAAGPMPFERGRTELLYGEWLRRNRRRSDAQHHLRSARDVFQRLEAECWAERARGELRASGQSQTTDTREHDPLGRLTPQEVQVVRLAVTGLSNRDIAAKLFLSPRTVAYHLSRAYPKLGVTSRNELAHVFKRTP